MQTATVRFPFAVRALAHRNFRLFMIGQGISLIGTFMQQVAVSWVVLALTNSAALLGVVAFAGQIPGLVIAPVAGVLVDRWNRHRLLLVTQSVAMFQALALKDYAGHLQNKKERADLDEQRKKFPAEQLTGEGKEEFGNLIKKLDQQLGWDKNQGKPLTNYDQLVEQRRQ